MARKLKKTFNGIVRKAEPADLDGIMAVEDTCFEPNEVWTRELLGEFLQRSEKIPDVVMVVASQDDNEILGYALGVIEDGIANVESVAVPDAQRGKGIGRALLERVVETLAEKGVDKITLQVRVDNVEGIRLYEKAGFVKTKPLPRYYDPQDGFEMVKPVKKAQPKL